MEWKVVFFESGRGEKYVEEFVFDQPEMVRAKIAHQIDLLEKHGVFLGMPWSKRLAADLYELRIRGKREIRILYSFRGRRIYLLHGFKKQTQKTPIKELKAARLRLKTIRS